MEFELESYDINILKKALKPYQISLIDSLLTNNTTDEAIEKYLTANGPDNTVQFGGSEEKKDKHPFISTFRNEFDKFICGHPDYEKYYPKVKEGTSIQINALISAMSAAIGARIGISAAMISPVIVLALSLIGQMGRKTYCEIRGYPLKIIPEKSE